MHITELGLPTHHSRVERWECDFNNHWNTRYYGRSFQMAAETVATGSDGISPGNGIVASRHMRFVGELFDGMPVAVRSGIVEGGVHDGALLHLLSSGNRISACALDRPGRVVAQLPRIAAADLGDVLPRGLDAIPADVWDLDRREGRYEIGPLRPADMDHTGVVLFEELIRCFATSIFHQLTELGYTTDFVERTGISRMAVEMRITRHAPLPLGKPLYARARLAHVSGKSFGVAQRLESPSGELLATTEQNLLAVDLNARKAVTVPDFIRL